MLTREETSRGNARTGDEGRALAEPVYSDGERMADKTPVGREQLEPLLLSLGQKHFVERILVLEGRLQRPRGMEDRHGEKRHRLTFQNRKHVLRREGTLARAGRATGLVLEPHFPDGHRAHMDADVAANQKTALGLTESPWRFHKIVEIGRIE